MERLTRILTSTGFLTGLALLLANDFVLKRAYPALLTGKLSDFAGLFVFSLFCTAVWPRRSREICVATAMAFAWWKSPLSQPAIDHWNSAFAYHIARVIDATDLIALAALPVSATYARRLSTRTTNAAHHRLMPLVSLLAFGGSLRGTESGVSYKIAKDDPTATYTLPSSFQDFPQRLDATGLFHDGYHLGEIGLRAPTRTPGLYLISMDNDCRRAVVEVTQSFSGTSLRLDELRAEEACKGHL
jgi:hypothetical protein